ncbi:MAG: tRNA lysidine(34) synthetase TilS [Ferruginibacter sp.]
MGQSLSSSFVQYIRKESLFSPDEPLLLAVSGGLDSMVLATLCHEHLFKIAIAHANFGLRGAESDADAALVEQWASKRMIPFHQHTFDTAAYASLHKQGIQEAARTLRYQWFQDLCSTFGYRYVVTAHHLDDQVETVLMKLFKGTGIRGMAGMRPQPSGLGQHVIRPLLFARREQLLAFANERSVVWREDRSNQSTDYTRNELRINVMPVIRSVFPDADKQIAQTINRLQGVADIYSESIQSNINRLITIRQEEQWMPVRKLQTNKHWQTIFYEWLYPVGFRPAQMAEAEKLMQADSGKWIASETHTLLKDRQHLVLFPTQRIQPDQLMIVEPTGSHRFPEGTLLFRMADSPSELERNDTIAQLDATPLVFPLKLRYWRAGDYFYPLGLNKKKKISRFLIDQKMPLHQKKHVRVLESDGKIVWVVGLRIDHRFRVTPSTQKIVASEFLAAKQDDL